MPLLLLLCCCCTYCFTYVPVPILSTVAVYVPLLYSLHCLLYAHKRTRCRAKHTSTYVSLLVRTAFCLKKETKPFPSWHPPPSGVQSDSSTEGRPLTIPARPKCARRSGHQTDRGDCLAPRLVREKLWNNSHHQCCSYRVTLWIALPVANRRLYAGNYCQTTDEVEPFWVSLIEIVFLRVACCMYVSVFTAVRTSSCTRTPHWRVMAYRYWYLCPCGCLVCIEPNYCCTAVVTTAVVYVHTGMYRCCTYVPVCTAAVCTAAVCMYRCCMYRCGMYHCCMYRCCMYRCGMYHCCMCRCCMYRCGMYHCCMYRWCMYRCCTCCLLYARPRTYPYVRRRASRNDYVQSVLSRLALLARVCSWSIHAIQQHGAVSSTSTRPLGPSRVCVPAMCILYSSK